MASQLEVGTHSVLSQWSQTGVVAGLQKRLEGMQQKVNDADAQVDKYRKKAAEEQEKARASEKEHETLRHKVQEAQEETVKMEKKWQQRMAELRDKFAQEMAKLQEEMAAGRRALELEQEEHEATRRELEEERKQAEENVHKLSECEVKIVELKRRSRTWSRSSRVRDSHSPRRMKPVTKR